MEEENKQNGFLNRLSKYDKLDRQLVQLKSKFTNKNLRPTMSNNEYYRNFENIKTTFEKIKPKNIIP